MQQSYRTFSSWWKVPCSRYFWQPSYGNWRVPQQQSFLTDNRLTRRNIRRILWKRNYVFVVYVFMISIMLLSAVACHHLLSIQEVVCQVFLNYPKWVTLNNCRFLQLSKMLTICIVCLLHRMSCDQSSTLELLFSVTIHWIWFWRGHDKVI